MNNLMDNVKQRATAQIDTQKGRATDGLSAIAGAVRQTTQHLRDEQHDGIAEYVDKAADQLERFSESLRNKDITELLDDARQLARRQPALFIGGSVVAGLLAARFIKSSQRNGQRGYLADSSGAGFTASGEFAGQRSGYGGSMPSAYPQRDAVPDVDPDTGLRTGSTFDRERL